MKKLLLALALIGLGAVAQAQTVCSNSPLTCGGGTAGGATAGGNNTFTGTNIFQDQAKFQIQNQADATKVFEVNLAGVTTANTLTLTLTGTAASPVISWAGLSTLAFTGNGSLAGEPNMTGTLFAGNNGATLVMDVGVVGSTPEIRMNGTTLFGWSSGSPSGTVIDTILSRDGQPGAYLLTCAGGLPTFSSGFGTSPSVTAGGCNSKFQVGVGTGGTATSGVIAFSGTLTTAQFCWVNDETTADATPTHAVATTTNVTISTSVAWAASTKLDVHCF